ncbi:SulP family inorganic anion transporter [Flagellimonas myxillae]|uniref:SulP family inorganic anion transporter n=1 Tax=Flagellimonas myxillae TaxID=2942214 RepID=UPI00201FA105|nr:solute carrier family 26 protein [Muricauda myxillae]MCL6266954.1 solute carrier family 26 protein [Muricauda myxillae]
MLARYFPIISWIKSYNRSTFLSDLSAGTTLGVMLVPQGMAYAMIAGLPPIYGLYAALIPQLVYAITGTSRQLAVGPVAMDSLLVATGIGALHLASIEDYISAVLFLTLVVGGIQLLLGIFRMGFFVNFLSKPVISGFTSAAAILIGLGQLKHILGTQFSQSSKVHELLQGVFDSFGNINAFTLLVGLIAIAMILILGKLSKRIPIALLVVVLGILGVTLFDLGDFGVPLVGEIPKGLPMFQLPNFQVVEFGKLLPIAITVALYGFTEAISIAKTVEERHPEYELDANQELRALGLSNLLGSFFQSIPVSGSFSRTAVNDQAGAKTGMSLVFSGLFIAGTLLFLTPLFYNLPTAVLGAIIMVSVFGLIDFKYPLTLWRHRKDEFLLLLATFVLTLFMGLIEGILLGVLLSLFLLVYRISHPHVAILGRVKNTDYFKNIDRFSEETEVDADKLILRFDAQLYFGNKDYFKRELYKQVRLKGNRLQYVILNAEAINYIDSSGAVMLERVVKDLQAKGIQFFITGAIGPTRDIFNSSGLIDIVGKENLFVKTLEAVEFCTNQKKRSSIQEKISLQAKT